MEYSGCLVWQKGKNGRGYGQVTPERGAREDYQAMRLLLILLLLSFEAGAAEYWVDLSGAGTGAADGSDASNLCAGSDDLDCAPSNGDTVYLSGVGETLTTSVAGVTYEWAPISLLPGEIDGGESETDCLIVTASNITHRNGSVHDCTTTGVWVDGAINTIEFDDFEAYNIPGTAAATGNGVCFIIDNLRSPGTTSAAHTITFRDTVAHHCGRMGYDTQTTGYNIQWVNAVAYENGFNYTGGGFYSHPYRVTVTSGWTVVSGTVYTRNSLGATDDVDVVWWNDGSQFLTEVSCGGAINVGEFCYNVGGSGVGYLRVNIGSDPAGDTIQYRRGPLTGLRWENVTAYNNRAPEGDTIHGTGLQIDDLTTDSVVQGGSFYGNDGAGIEAFRAMDIEINSPVVWGNGTNAALDEPERANVQLQGESLEINNITSHGAGTHAIQMGPGTSTCNNCVLSGSAGFGARASVGTLTLNNADIFGNTEGATEEVASGVVTNNGAITTDPQFLGNTTGPDYFRPLATSPLIRAGTCYLSVGCSHPDFNDQAQTIPPTIGAFSGGGSDAVAPERTPIP